MTHLSDVQRHEAYNHAQYQAYAFAQQMSDENDGERVFELGFEAQVWAHVAVALRRDGDRS